MGVAACTGLSGVPCMLPWEVFWNKSSQQLLQWVSAVVQASAVLLLAAGSQCWGIRNVPLCLNSHWYSKQGRKMLEKYSTELSLASLCPEHPGNTKTPCKNYQGHWERVILFFLFIAEHPRKDTLELINFCLYDTGWSLVLTGSWTKILN